MIRKKELEARGRGETESADGFAAIRNRLAPILQRQFGMPDIPLTSDPQRSRTKGNIEDSQGETPQQALARLRVEYTTQPHTPDFIRNTWQTMNGAWVAIANAKQEDSTLHIPVPTVPDCGRTQAQLEALRKNNMARVYVAPFDYPILARIFPNMGNGNVATGRARDDTPTKGWYDVPMDIVPRNLGITEAGLRAQAVDGLEVGSAKTLIWAGQASHVLDKEGRYLGEKGHWFLLPNTRVDGRVAGGGFAPGGGFSVDGTWYPGIPDRYRGGLLQGK